MSGTNWPQLWFDFIRQLFRQFGVLKQQVHSPRGRYLVVGLPLLFLGLFFLVPLLIVLVATTVGLIRYAGVRRDVFRSAEQREWTVCALRVMLMLWIHAMVERAFAGTAAPSTVVLAVCVATYVFTSLQLKADQQARLARVRDLR